MFKSILSELNANTGFSKSKLAKKLNTTEGIIDDSIEHLIRLGYLNKSESEVDCKVTCSSCPYASSCQKDLVTFYNLSDKGRAYLNK